MRILGTFFSWFLRENPSSLNSRMSRFLHVEGNWWWESHIWLQMNNAGVAKKDVNVENADLVLGTNYYGVKQVTDALMPLLRNSTHDSRIVVTGSRAGELKVRLTFFTSFCSWLSIDFFISFALGWALVFSHLLLLVEHLVEHWFLAFSSSNSGLCCKAKALQNDTICKLMLSLHLFL